MRRLAIALALLQLFSCMPARAQQPGQLGPQSQFFYSRNGRIPVQIFDGGTASRDVATARARLGVPWADGADSLTASWIMSGSLIAPYCYLRDSLTTFQAYGDTTKRLKLELGAFRTNTLHLWLPDTTVGACNVPCLQGNQTWTGVNNFNSQVNIAAGSLFELTTACGGTYLVSGATCGAPGTATLKDGSGTLAWTTDVQNNSNASVYDPLLRVKDSQFFVKDDGDTTKKFQVQVSGVSTNTTRTLTIPDASGTIPLPALSQTWSGAQYFNSTDLNINNAGMTGAATLNYASGTGNSAYFPALDGSVIIHDGAQPLGTKTLYTSNTYNAKDTGWNLKKSTDTTKVATFNASLLTASRQDTLPNIAGNFVIRSYSRDFTGQTADLGSTTMLTSPPAGKYEIWAYLEDTTIGVGTEVVTFAWTDDVGATTDASTSLSLTGTGHVGKLIPAYIASGNLTFSTAGYVSGTFALRLAVKGPL
jgi:hypothetical protein